MDTSSSAESLAAMQEVDSPARSRSLRRAAYHTAGLGLAHVVLYVLSYALLTSIPNARASGDRRRLILILFFGLFFSAAAATAASAASIEFSGVDTDPAVARQLPLFSNTLLIVFAMRMAAMFVFTTSSIGRTSGVLPRWFVFLGYAVGLFLLLSATLSTILVLVFPTWLTVLCAILMWRARGIPAEATLEIATRRRPELPGLDHPDLRLPARHRRDRRHGLRQQEQHPRPDQAGGHWDDVARSSPSA